MEKIIAVVVMIAIVIGLIATAVMPMVGQMNEQGNQANNQLGMLTSTLDGQLLTGSTVKAEILSNASKFNLGSEKLTRIDVKAAVGSSFTDIGFDVAPTAAGLVSIPDNAVFTKATTTYASGTVKTITYTEEKR